MGDFKEYDPDLVDVLFDGVPLSGFDEDTFVTIESDEDSFVTKKGADGSVTRSKVLGRIHTITFHLMSSSVSNAYLSAIAELDQASPGGAGVGPCAIRDRNGNSIFATDKAWISKEPTVTYGKQATAREWKIQAVNAKFFEGGIA